MQRAVQGAPIQETRTHGTTPMRAGVFDRVEAVVQADQGDPDTPGFNGSAIPRSQAPGIGHVTPVVHGPR